MNTSHTSGGQSANRVGSGDAAAPGAVGLLALAAAPIFAAMALWTGVFQPDMLCMAAPDASPLGGMSVMYLLMSAVHLTPWLRLIAGGQAVC